MSRHWRVNPRGLKTKQRFPCAHCATLSLPDKIVIIRHIETVAFFSSEPRIVSPALGRKQAARASIEEKIEGLRVSMTQAGSCWPRHKLGQPRQIVSRRRGGEGLSDALPSSELGFLLSGDFLIHTEDSSIRLLTRYTQRSRRVASCGRHSPTRARWCSARHAASLSSRAVR
jgi:hypothetical protein